MNYLVTGGTGFIGTKLIDRLVEDGHEVVALTRDRARAEHLPESIEVAEADITDRSSLREPMDGVDGLFHLAAWYQLGPGPWNVGKVERINVDGTRNVLEVMDELDVSKGVYSSTVGVYGNTGGTYVDESYRSPNDFPTVYQRTKWRAHYEVAEPMMDAGLPLVVTTLGGIYGPGDKILGGTPRMAFTMYLNRELPALPSDLVFPVDHVDDTVESLVRAMEAGTPGEEYIVANDPINFAELFEIAEELVGIPVPRTLPGTVMRWLSYGVAALETVTRPPEGMESELLRFFDTGGVLVDNSKAEAELGIEHRPYREGLREYLEWEVAQQGMEDVIDSELAG